MLNQTLYQYQNSPFVLLLIIGLGMAFHSFALNWAAGILLPQSISYMRSALTVIGLFVVNAGVAYILQDNSIALKSPGGIAAAIIASTALVSVVFQSEPVNALLILLLSTVVTAGGGIVFLALCERAAAAIY